MSDVKWRKELELLIETNLSELLKETMKYNDAISKAKDKSKAQIWVAMAILNHKINSISLEKGKSEKKIPEEELSKILKTLEKL